MAKQTKLGKFLTKITGAQRVVDGMKPEKKKPKDTRSTEQRNDDTAKDLRARSGAPDVVADSVEHNSKGRTAALGTKKVTRADVLKALKKKRR